MALQAKKNLYFILSWLVFLIQSVISRRHNTLLSRLSTSIRFFVIESVSVSWPYATTIPSFHAQSVFNVDKSLFLTLPVLNVDESEYQLSPFFYVNKAHLATQSVLT